MTSERRERAGSPHRTHAKQQATEEKAKGRRNGTKKKTSASKPPKTHARRILHTKEAKNPKKVHTKKKIHREATPHTKQKNRTRDKKRTRKEYARPGEMGVREWLHNVKEFLRQELAHSCPAAHLYQAHDSKSQGAQQQNDLRQGSGCERKNKDDRKGEGKGDPPIAAPRCEPLHAALPPWCTGPQGWPAGG